MIVLISQYKHTRCDAGSVRMHNFALTLLNQNKDVIIIDFDRTKSKEEIIDGVKYLSLGSKNRYLSFLFLLPKLIMVLSRINSRISSIIISDLFLHLFLYVKLFCRIKKINLVVDVVEWYSASQFRLRKIAPAFVLKNLMNTFLIDKSVSVIAISTFLYNYFSKKGINVVLIPIYMQQKIIHKEPNDSKLRIIYAGSPNGKDFLNIILKGLLLLPNELLCKIEFKIFGVNNDFAETYVNEIEGINRLFGSVTFFGRVERQTILSEYKKMDFSILVRDSNKRYAKAGFPTKVIESISMATPIIMNFSSDLDSYFVDEVDCIRIYGHEPLNVSHAIERALRLTKEEKNVMCLKANELAIRQFNLDSFKDNLLQIIE